MSKISGKYLPEEYLDFCNVDTYAENALLGEIFTDNFDYTVIKEVFLEIGRLIEAKADPKAICDEFNIEGKDWIDAFWCLSRWRFDNCG